MSAVGITENVKGDAKKFEIWYNGREEVYIIQVKDRIRHEKAFSCLNPQSCTIMFFFWLILDVCACVCVRDSCVCHARFDFQINSNSR